MVRAFIGIILPEHVQARIFHEIETLSKKGFFRGKFVEKGNLHLNLKFLSEVSEEKIEDLKKKLSEIKFKKFEASIGKIGAFPHLNYVRVLWLEFLSEENKAQELYKKINSVVQYKTNEAFAPHITLGRVKSIKDKKKLVEALQRINFKKLDFEVDEFCLIKSELTEKGPIYRIIEKFGLK